MRGRLFAPAFRGRILAPIASSKVSAKKEKDHVNTNAGFALLVGVNDYSSFGPGSNLQGSREDVLKLYWFARELLGLSPENVRVLASPPLSAADFYMTSPPPPEMLGEATQASMQVGMQWLADRMGTETAAPGLLTFSGHGSYSKERGPLLCPTDIGPDLAKGIAARELSTMPALQRVRERLTVVLDCCHVAGEAPPSNLRAATALPHNATADEVAADHADFDISERVLLAARLGQSAYQALLGKVHHGALTFALVTVAEQWKASQEPGSSGMHVSYKQLLKRIRKLLWSLRMKQNVRLRVPMEPMGKRKAIRSLPFFGTKAGVTLRKPDAPRQKAQFDGGWHYILSVPQGTTPETYVTLAHVIAPANQSVPVTVTKTGNPPVTYTAYQAPADKESWYINSASFGNLSASASIQITATQLLPTSTVAITSATRPSSSPDQTSSESTAWTEGSPTVDPDYTSLYFKGNDVLTGNTLYLQLVCKMDNEVVTAIENIYWSLATTVAPSYILPGGTITVTSATFSGQTAAPTASTIMTAQVF